MRTKGFVLILTLSFILTACGGTAATDPTAVPAEPTDEPAAVVSEPTSAAATETEAPPEPTLDPTAAATAEPTPEPATTTASSVQRYVIVPEESQVTYEVDETFFREGNRLATAVGVTQIISGEVAFDPSAPQSATISPITIDISAFTSDSSRRDNAIRERWLESASYPIARFEPTEIQGLPETYTEGEVVNLQIIGNLTVRETTQPVTFDFTGKLENNELTGTATTELQMTDFGFDPPDIAGILRAENDVRLTFDLVARPAS